VLLVAARGDLTTIIYTGSAHGTNRFSKPTLIPRIVEHLDVMFNS